MTVEYLKLLWYRFLKLLDLLSDFVLKSLPVIGHKNISESSSFRVTFVISYSKVSK